MEKAENKRKNLYEDLARLGNFDELATQAAYNKDKVYLTWRTNGKNTCKECAKRNGKTQLIEDWEVFPPLHPNCRCRLEVTKVVLSAGENSVDRIDSAGVYWEYSQSTGELYKVDETTGKREFVGKGYSGHGKGINNPKKESEKFVGPIPRGEYNIWKPYNSKKVGPFSLPLIPINGEEQLLGRDNDFRIHGDRKGCFRCASEGCIILNRNIREKIWKSGNLTLRVVK